MGYPAALAYASIFMLSVEIQHLTILRAPASLFFHYLDDLFAIPPHQTVQAAVEEPLLTKCPVRFTDQHAGSAGELCWWSDSYNSPLQGHQLVPYIHPSSSHPGHTWRAIPPGEFARVSRAASDTFTASQLHHFLADRLIDQGYPRNIVFRALAPRRNRKPHALSGNRPMPLALEYHPSLQSHSPALGAMWPRPPLPSSSRDLEEGQTPIGIC